VDEEAVVLRLARARKAPRDAVMRARMVELSWAGSWVPAIAIELDCSEKTVRRICEAERSRIIGLVGQAPPSRIRHVFIPVSACWLNLQEGWWRIFRKTALAGQPFAGADEMDQATCLATAQVNARAKPWVCGRPAPPTRRLRRRYVYVF
jgi:hypothetical protein